MPTTRSIKRTTPILIDTPIPVGVLNQFHPVESLLVVGAVSDGCSTGCSSISSTGTTGTTGTSDIADVPIIPVSPTITGVGTDTTVVVCIGGVVSVLLRL